MPADLSGQSCSQTLSRTETGILSNRRPVEGTPATSDPSTPSADSDSSKTRVNLLATAKRQAAKKSLYSRFFKGPVLGPDHKEQDPVSRDIPQISDSSVYENMDMDSKAVIDVQEGRASKRRRDVEGKDEGSPKQKQRRKKKRKGSPLGRQDTAKLEEKERKRKSKP
jgi:nucleolar protein TMA23